MLTSHSQTGTSSLTWGTLPAPNPCLLAWGPPTLTRHGGRLGVENCATMRSRSIVSSFQLPPEPPGQGRCHHYSHPVPAEPESQAGGFIVRCPLFPGKQRDAHRGTVTDNHTQLWVSRLLSPFIQQVLVVSWDCQIWGHTRPHGTTTHHLMTAVCRGGS